MNRVLRTFMILPVLSFAVFALACAHEQGVRSEYKYKSETKGTAAATPEVRPAPVDRDVTRSYYERQERSTAVAPGPTDEGGGRSYYEHRERSVDMGRAPADEDMSRSYYDRRDRDFYPSDYPPPDASDSSRTRSYYERREIRSFGTDHLDDTMPDMPRY